MATEKSGSALTAGTADLRPTEYRPASHLLLQQLLQAERELLECAAISLTSQK